MAILHDASSRSSSAISFRSSGTRQLSTVVDPELLRGVKVVLALAGFGNHWEGSVDGGLGEDERAQRAYMQSEKVERLDDFISHDWATGRRIKYMALLLIYNGPAAIICSDLTCALSVALNTCGALLHYPSSTTQGLHARLGFWSIALSPVVYVFVLLFWQRLRTLLPLTPRKIFVDKMCINQTDQQVKSRAILSLAGIVKCSDRLVILWTPRYLTRLWCVYEVATWTHLGKGFRSFVFMPVMMAAAVFTAIGSFYLFFLAVALNDTFGQNIMSQQLIMRMILLAMVRVCILPGLALILRRLLRDLSAMREQLSTFKTESSECFCCSVGHKSPETGAVIPCDRALVYKQIQAWESSEVSTNATAALDSFDTYVRNEVCSEVMSSLVSGKSRYVLGVMAAAPTFWYLGDRQVQQFTTSSPSPVLIFYSAVVAFALYPALFDLSLRLALVANRMARDRSGKGGCRDHLSTLFLVLTVLVSDIVLWAPFIVLPSVGLLAGFAICAALLVLSLAEFFLPLRP